MAHWRGCSNSDYILVGTIHKFIIDSLIFVFQSKHSSNLGHREYHVTHLTYLHSLKIRIFVEMSFENQFYTNLLNLIQEFVQILMNENSKSFYPRDMFEFIHHLKYGCRDH
jgi:hypothetical protein